eukprot:TRINITY_DN40128_c0_g1_i1.p1 TRINITY_DN40128_c0_g1~~TRINITY_DN40128_c0_g1_i1.p1  ORF type:complete len:629 (+),score=179.74 TRINITY_DN40128_c0_g1_i1:158-2044(+)
MAAGKGSEPFGASKSHRRSAPRIVDIPWTQQRLVAWQPLWDPPYALSCLAAAAVIMIPIGAVLLSQADSITSKTITYGDRADVRSCHWTDTSNYRCFLPPCTPAAVNGVEPGGAECCDHSQSSVLNDACRDPQQCGMMGSLGAGCPRNFSHRVSPATWTRAALDAMETCDAFCPVTVSFTLDETITGPLVMYYHLTQFWQNHRFYASSRDQKQLNGDGPTSVEEFVEYIRPLQTVGQRNDDDFCENEWGDECDSVDFRDCPRDAYGTAGRCTDPRERDLGSIYYSPGGLVAWSMFNDSFQLYRRNSDGSRTLVCDTASFDADNTPNTREWGIGASTSRPAMSCTKSDIAWHADTGWKFKSPKLDDPGTVSTLAAGGLKNILRECMTAGTQRCEMEIGTGSGQDTRHRSAIPFLYHGWYMWEPYHKIPSQTDEDLMVWMRTAPLHSFRKTLRYANTDLPAGNYELVIRNRFDVTPFGGTKAFIIQNMSPTGGGAMFLGGMYLAFGLLCACVALLLLVKWLLDREEREGVLDQWAELAARRAERQRGGVFAVRVTVDGASHSIDAPATGSVDGIRAKLEEKGVKADGLTFFRTTQDGRQEIDPSSSLQSQMHRPALHQPLDISAQRDQQK